MIVSRPGEYHFYYYNDNASHPSVSISVHGRLILPLSKLTNENEVAFVARSPSSQSHSLISIYYQIDETSFLGNNIHLNSYLNQRDTETNKSGEN